jgi:hypothetical protein
LEEEEVEERVMLSAVTIEEVAVVEEVRFLQHTMSF